MVEQVVTKLLPPATALGRVQFLVDLLQQRRPSQVGRVLECSRGEGGPTVSRQFVGGVSLAERRKPLPRQELVRLGVQLLAAVHQLHGHGLLHGNLKPANVIVGSNGSVTLVDLARLTSPARNPYMAPEMSGHLGAAVSEASDVYSAALILLELATGGLELCALPPEDPLQLILPAMLQSDPVLRLQDASVAERVLSQSERDARGSSPVFVPHFTRFPLVGRGAQLAQIQALWEQPRPGVVTIHGEQGTGKTRLVEDLIYKLQADRIWSAQSCPETPTSLPFLRPLGISAADPGGGPEEFATVRLLEGIVSQVRQLCLGDRTLWIWDDLEDDDELSHTLLARLARTPLPGLLVVATLRGVAEGPPGAVRLTLGNLSFEQVSLLVKARLGPPADELVELLLEASQGNPLWATQTLRGLETEAQVYRQQRRWRPRDPAPRYTPQQWLERRVDSLDVPLRTVLSRCAAIGTTFSVQQAELVHPEPDLWQQLNAARRARLLLESPDGRGLRFPHRSLRAHCLERLAAAERISLWLRLAEQAPSARSQLHYLREAGCPDVRSILAAVEEACSAADWSVALTLLELAQGSPEAEDRAAEVLFFSGQYGRAEQAYTRLLSIRTEPGDRARLRMRLGRVALLLGNLGRAAEHWNAASELLASGSEALLEALVRLSDSRYNLGPHAMLMQSSMLARALPDQHASVWALANQAVNRAHERRRREARAAARAVLPLLAACPDRWTRGVATVRVAYTYVALGKLAQAQRLMERAARDLEGTGDLQEQSIARYWRHQITHYRGHPHPDPHELEAALHSNFPYAVSTSRLALAQRGCLTSVDVQRAWDGDPPLIYATNQLATALDWFFQGRLRPAARLIERLDGTGHPPREAEIHCWRATILRSLLLVAPPGLRRSTWRRAHRAAREALRRSRIFRIMMPHALRELGLLAAESGRPDRARRYLERSLHYAELMGANLEVARSLTELGRLGTLLGWPNSGPTLQAGLKGLAVCQAPEQRPEDNVIPRTHLDRFQQLLVWGTRLTRQLNEDLVLETARQGLAQLLQAESCTILPAGQESPLDALLTSPVVCDGEPVCTLSARHRLPHGRYSEEEKHLAACLTALTEVGVSNARTFAAKVRSSESLQASHQRFQALLDGAGAGVALVDDEDRILEHNVELLRILEQETVVGRSFLDLLEPAYQAAERQRFDSGLEKYSVEVPFCSPGPSWARLSLLRVKPSGLIIRSISPSNPVRLQELLHFQGQERSAWARQLKTQVEAPLERLLEQLEGHPLACEMAARLRQELRDTRRGLQSRRRLPQLLETLLAQTQADPRLVLDWNLPMEEVDDLTASCLDRCLLELVSNAARHAEATRIAIQVELLGGYLKASVTDDGQGFALEELDSSRRHGLKGVRFRIELLGGQLQLTSEKGRGSRVRFSLPL